MEQLPTQTDPASPEKNPSHIELEDDSRVAVIGGGPAGSFFSYFFLEMAEKVGLELSVDIYEPRDFSGVDSASCNMCGGIIPESLIGALVDDSRGSIDSYRPARPRCLCSAAEERFFCPASRSLLCCGRAFLEFGSL